MFMMGLRNSVFWASWSVLYFVIIAAVTVAITLVATLAKLFENSNMFLLFIMLMLYGLSIVALAFFLTTFFNKAHTAGAVTSLPTIIIAVLYVATIHTPELVDKQAVHIKGFTEWSLPALWLVCLFPPLAFAFAVELAVFLDTERGGMDFNTIYETEFPLLAPLLMLIADIFLYILLAVYLDHVIPHDSGPRYGPGDEEVTAISLEISQVLKAVGLTSNANVPSSVLTGGQKRKLAVALAIIGDPKVLLLDEPTTGMDPFSRRYLWSLLKNYKEGRPRKVTDFLEEYVRGVVYPRIHGKELAYTIPLSELDNFVQLFKALEETDGDGVTKAESLGILNYSVSMPTLEEVFLKLGTVRILATDSATGMIKSYAILYDFVAVHSLPAAINAISTALLRQAGSSRDIVASSKPWPSVLTEANVVDTVLGYALLVLIDKCTLVGSIQETVGLSKPKYVENRAADDNNSPDEDEDVAVERMKVETLARMGIDNSNTVAYVRQLRREFSSTSRRTGREAANTDKVAVKNLSFAVNKGEVLGLMGHNGSGKTTTVRMMTGEIRPTCGSVVIARSQIRSNIGGGLMDVGFCPQIDALWEPLDLTDHLMIYAAIKGVPQRDTHHIVNYFIESLKLQPYRDKPVRRLSYGTRRKLSYAIAMLGNPKVVLLDEPSTGMDPRSKRFFWDTISSSFEGSDRGAILTTHYMEEADALCSRVGILVNGQLECLGPTQRLKSRFGKGYVLDVKLSAAHHMSQDNLKEVMARLENYLVEHFPNSRCLEKYDSACVLPSGAFISAGVTLEANGTECTCPELTVDNDPDLGPRPALCCDKVEGAQEKAKADKLSAKVKKLGAKCTKRKNATKCQERVRNLEAKLAKVNQNNDTQGPTCAERKAAERERDIASLASHLAKCEKKSGKTAEKCLKRAALKAMKIKGMERKGKKQETGQDEVDGASEAGSNDRCAKFKGKRAEKCLERVAAKSGQDKNSGDRDTGKTTGAEKCAKFKGKRAEKCLERVAAKSGQDKNSGDRDTGKTTGAEKCAKFKGKRAEKCLERVAAKSGQDKNSGDRDTGKTTGAEKCAKFKGKRAQRCMERMEAKEDQDLIDRCVNLTGTEAKKCLQRDQKQLEKEMQEKCAKFQGKRAKECMVKMAKKAERMRKKAGRAQKRASSKAA
nr:hypothetical protein BaRGS_004991 [Batillaria attramentaria]